MRDANALQSGTDLIEDFAAMRDDDNARPPLEDLGRDVGKEDCFTGAGRADRQRAVCSRSERPSDIVCQLVLVRPEFHKITPLFGSGWARFLS
jgi:hypothetical protein